MKTVFFEFQTSSCTKECFFLHGSTQGVEQQCDYIFNVIWTPIFGQKGFTIEPIEYKNKRKQEILDFVIFHRQRRLIFFTPLTQDILVFFQLAGEKLDRMASDGRPTGTSLSISKSPNIGEDSKTYFD